MLDFLRFVVVFFQAEEGIRDLTVTGVQTCALPIYAVPRERGRPRPQVGNLPGDGIDVSRQPNQVVERVSHDAELCYLCRSRRAVGDSFKNVPEWHFTAPPPRPRRRSRTS